MRIKLFGGLRPLTRERLVRDGFAGVSLAAMDIPQVLGYARIAGMPAVTGLYTVFLPLIAFAAFGASRHLVVAADSATATIMAGQLSLMAPADLAHYADLAAVMTLMVAVLLVIARIFRLGFLADFMSRTVLVGFLSGVGIQVGIAMLGVMFEIPVNSSRTPEQLFIVVTHLMDAHGLSATLALAVTLSVLLTGRYWPRFPMAFIVVALTIWASWAFDFERLGFSLVGEVAGGLPMPRLPQVTWGETVQLIPAALSCFVMIVAQSLAAARSYADQYREEEDVNDDILGLAAANFAAVAGGAFVVNGSPTQSAMAETAGSRSQFTQVVFAVVVLVVLLFFSQTLRYLPHCVLGAIVFTIALHLVKVKDLRHIRRESPGEFGLALTTAAAVVFVGVEQGILLAMALSILRHVRHSYRPHTQILVPDAQGVWRPQPAAPGLETAPGLLIYRFGADLFFANDKFFAGEVRRLIAAAPDKVQTLLIDAGAISDLDYSAACALGELCGNLHDQGIRVVFARVSSYLRADMHRHGIFEVLGESNIFATLHEAIVSVHPQSRLTS